MKPENGRMSRAGIAVIAALGIGALVSACTSVPGAPGLGGSASMRIEVEVYKGPLSQEPDVQWGELRGLVTDAPRLLGLLDDALIAAAHAEGYLPSAYPSENVRRGQAFISENRVLGRSFKKVSDAFDVAGKRLDEAKSSLKDDPKKPIEPNFLTEEIKNISKKHRVLATQSEKIIGDWRRFRDGNSANNFYWKKHSTL